ncbi:hypothetical protein Scep_027664 [Stephania cephalantha]|uniref:Pentatricopeptide repeat-containing protein n=1 Tax=Stephania cephalantha TaxID=152367 RepID=A0AAP0EBS5_9MAGN
MGAHYNLRRTIFSSASNYINTHVAHTHRSSNSKTEVGLIAQCCMSCSARFFGVRHGSFSYGTMVQSRVLDECTPKPVASPEYYNQSMQSSNNERIEQIGQNVSRKDKVKFLLDTLSGLKNSKEVVYGALDAWVAWEQTFPTVSLKRVLIMLGKEYQWHRVVQVIKWMLSKGHGNTMGTYSQLIHALDMDHRAEEAHHFWVKKIGHDLHSVPWKLCTLMMSIYYRNDMLERLVKLFKGLEAFDRKPPDKSIIQRVANVYEILGSLEEQKRVLDKYNYLFSETWKGQPKKSSKASSKKVKKSGKNNVEGSENLSGTSDGANE